MGVEAEQPKPGNISNFLRDRLDYSNYLNSFESRPPLTGCTGPMSFEEWRKGRVSLRNLIKIAKDNKK